MIDINYEYMYRRAKVAYRLLRKFVRSYRRTDGQTNYSIGVASLKQLLYKHPGCARQGFPVTPQFCKNWCNDYSFCLAECCEKTGEKLGGHTNCINICLCMYIYGYVDLCLFMTHILCLCVCKSI